MKRRLLPLLCVCLLLSGCSGLPYPREMGDMALLRTMGVDGADSKLIVTVSTGPRARGLQGEQQPALVLSAQKDSLSGAALALQGLSDSYVYFGYVDQLLVGEELARQGVSEVLDYFARDVELGLGAQLWVVRGTTAQKAVESGGEQGVDSRLSTLQTDGEMGVAAISRTAGEVYTDLLEQGASYVPALRASGEGGTLGEGGYAVLQGERLAGFLEGDAARGLELLAGKPAADTLEVELSSGRVVLRITGAATTCSLTEEGLSLTCRVTAQLAEYQRAPTGEELKQLRRALAEREEGRIRLALTALRQWRADCVGLGPKAALSSPGRWSALAENWPQVFSQRAPELTVQAAIRR